MAERFGDFELLALLSADAALESFLAAPPGGGPQVVLRRMRLAHAQQPGARDAFLNDAQAAMRLQHPGVARVVSVGEVGHLPYLAQERVDGVSLETIVLRARQTAGWPLPLPRALALFLPALEGLAAAHAQKPALLHREVSPRNVFVTPQGRAVLTGFGLARSRRSAGLGITDAFLSPEQMTGRPLDPASDVFTAALMLFELACGRLPATGSVGEIAARIGALELDAPEVVHPGAAPLREVLVKALGRRDARYLDAGQFLAALIATGIAPEAQSALAPWIGQLPQHVLPPAPPPRTEPLPRPATAASALPDLAAPAASPEPPSAASRRALSARARVGLGILAGLAAAALAQGMFSTNTAPATAAVANPVPETFETEVLSVPPGAWVRVNEERIGKTPTRFHAERDHVYALRIDNELVTMELTAQNSQRVEVDMEAQELLQDVRFVPGPTRQERKKPKKVQTTQKTAPEDPQKPAPAYRFQATAPARFVLEKPHQIRVDDISQLPLRAGPIHQTNAGFRNAASRSSASAVFQNQGLPGRGRPREVLQKMQNVDPGKLVAVDGVLRHLSMVLTRTSRGVLLRPVGATPIMVSAEPSWAFALSERTVGTLDASPAFIFGDRVFGNQASLVVVVERDNRFTIDGLNNPQPWKLSLHAQDPARAARVVLKVTPALDGALVLLDGAAVENATAVLDPDGAHTLTGAREAWLAVPTVSGFEPSPVEVALEQAPGPNDPQAPGTTPER